MDSAAGGGESGGSTANVGLTRDAVINTALNLMDEHGVEWLSMRRLGDALGVRAPTLYWHFENKQALHDACVQRALEQITLPEVSGGDWRGGVRQFMSSVREQLNRHPSISELMRHSQPPALAQVSAHALALMRSAGLEWEQAYLYCRLMIWRIVGFTGMENSLRDGASSHTVDPDQPNPSAPTRFHLLREWPASVPPQAKALSKSVDLDEMFRADIDVFIHGVEAVRRPAKSRTGRPGIPAAMNDP